MFEWNIRGNDHKNLISTNRLEMKEGQKNQKSGLYPLFLQSLPERGEEGSRARSREVEKGKEMNGAMVKGGEGWKVREALGEGKARVGEVGE